MASGIRAVGDFCWINVLTSRPAEAMAFFGRVLGWTYTEMPPFGHGIKVDGRAIGGLFDLDGPGCPPGLAPTVGVMIKVLDADATVGAVRALGGEAGEAFDIADRGRMATCHDPLGAAFDVWEPRANPGTDVARSSPGAASWSELMSTDPGRAAEFYRGIFGWEPEARAMLGVDYTVFRHDGAEIAGLMAVPRPDIPPHWGTYFAVDDADEAARAAAAMGGEVFVPPMDIPGVGRFCGLVSPQGVRFYAIRHAPGG